MITNYAEVDRMRLLLLLLLLTIVIPLFLILSSTLTVASATSCPPAPTIPETVSTTISSNQIDPILLAPMATSGNNVYVVWSSNMTGHLEILFRASSDNGQTFVDKVNLSNTPNVDSIDPDLAALGNNVYISWWQDYGNGTRVPFFKASNDNGQTFGPVLSLSDEGPIPVKSPVPVQDDINIC